jgi:hypothetical protein
MSFSFDDIVKTVNRWKRATHETATDAKQRASWVWEALQGDFNPNRSTGQIGFDTAVCLVPGVDTIMDIRDLIANLITLARTPTSGMAWFSLVLTLVGFVPELGSVAKGVVKIVFVKMRPLIKNAEDLKDSSKMVNYLNEAFDLAMPSLVQYLNHPKVQKFLTTKGVPDVITWVAASIKKAASVIDTAKLKALFNTAAESVKTTLNLLKPLLPDAAAKKITTVFNGIVTVQKKFDGMVNDFVEPMRAVMRRLAVRLEEMHWVAHTQQVNKGWIAPLSEAGATKLIAKHKPRWVKSKRPVLFKQLIPDNFRGGPTYKNGLKQGAPELDEAAIKSFSAGVKARPLRDGEALYRIVDPTSGSMSTCWITESVWKEINANPELAREIWRSKLAVLPHWNQNGTYVKFTYNKARDGEITVWEGPTAMQYLNDRTKNLEEGFLEGGLNQVVFDPMKQIKGAKADTFASTAPDVRGIQFPDMVEGGIIKDKDGQARRHGVRSKINDPRIEGPIETGWGFKDFDDQHDIIGLPNPLKE